MAIFLSLSIILKKHCLNLIWLLCLVLYHCFLYKIFLFLVILLASLGNFAFLTPSVIHITIYLMDDTNISFFDTLVKRRTPPFKEFVANEIVVFYSFYNRVINLAKTHPSRI